jgi:hypothetical protein
VRRPRPIFLGLLGLALVLLIIYAVWPAASQRGGPSNQTRTGRTQAGRGNAESADTLPGQLDVRLEALKQAPTAPEDPARNPFRFYVKPPPPPPPPAKAVPAPPPPPVDPNYVPPPPPPPPIPLKFIGTLEVGGKKVAIFSDGRGLPLYGKEGEPILGQYRLVKIGVESVVMEYLDGRGRQTIPMRGGQ